MFLGTTFFTGKHTFLPPATNLNFHSLSISDGTYDHLYLSEDINSTIESLDADWTYETKLNANFDKNLDAGNSGFSLKTTDTIVIRKRERDTLNWTTIYTIPVREFADFNFTRYYPYAANHADSEYMLISTINGIENSYVITPCLSEFDGFFIVDKDHIYGTIYNLAPVDTTQNSNVTVLELLNNRYPSVYTNSQCNYVNGYTSGCFLKLNPDTQTVDTKAGIRYRQEFMDWLTNGKSKLIKLEDGRIYLARISGKPTETQEGPSELKRIGFDWTQIGDAESPRDLYLNSLSDIPEKWW